MFGEEISTQFCNDNEISMIRMLSGPSMLFGQLNLLGVSAGAWNDGYVAIEFFEPNRAADFETFLSAFKGEQQMFSESLLIEISIPEGMNLIFQTNEDS